MKSADVCAFQAVGEVRQGFPNKTFAVPCAHALAAYGRQTLRVFLKYQKTQTYTHPPFGEEWGLLSNLLDFLKI